MHCVLYSHGRLSFLCRPASLSFKEHTAKAGRSSRLGERTGDNAVSPSGIACVRSNIEGRGVAMINASQIKEHMEVKGSDGKHVGTVLGVEGEQVKIASGGMDHFIDRRPQQVTR
jgi:hypothetical protein